MKKDIFLTFLIIVSFFMLINNFLTILTSPIHTFINLFLASLIAILAFFYGKSVQKEQYDYDKENPNALVSGKNISGSVYSSYPNFTPGLGWVL